MPHYRQYTIKINLTAELLSALATKYAAIEDAAIKATLERLLMGKLRALREELDAQARTATAESLTKTCKA